MAAYSFVSYDETSYQKLTDAANANIGTGTTVTASFSTDITNIRNSTGVSYSYTGLGLGFNRAKLPGADNIVDSSLSLGTLGLDGPVVIGFSTDTYSGVDKCPDFTQVDINRNKYSVSVHGEKGYADMKLLIPNSLNEVSSAQAMYGRYGFLALDPKLDVVANKLELDKRSITDWINSVHGDPTQMMLDLRFVGVSDGVPKPSVSIRYSSSPIGGPGGSGFDDVDEDMIRRGILPRTITVRGDQAVDRITTEYCFVYPQEKPYTTQHGNDGGRDGPPLLLAYNESVTLISAMYDDGGCLHRIGISTNLGTDTSSMPPRNGIVYPNNDNGDKNGTISVPQGNCRFVGWRGCAGRFVDSIQAVFVELGPATWTSVSTQATENA